MIHKTSCRNLYSIERTASHIFSLLFVLFFLGGGGGWGFSSNLTIAHTPFCMSTENSRNFSATYHTTFKLLAGDYLGHEICYQCLT